MEEKYKYKKLYSNAHKYVNFALVILIIIEVVLLSIQNIQLLCGLGIDTPSRRMEGGHWEYLVKTMLIAYQMNLVGAILSLAVYLLHKKTEIIMGEWIGHLMNMAIVIIGGVFLVIVFSVKMQN